MLRIPLPTRVSRLYPVFSLVLAISSSVFYYAWQTTESEVNGLSAIQEQQKSLHLQIDQLTSQQKLDNARLQVQNQHLADANSQLQAIQKQLEQRAADLATKDKLLAQSQAQLKQQQDQLSQNAADLEKLRSRPPLFSFQNKSSQTDLAGQEAGVKQVVSDAFGYIQKIYGTPYLLNNVTITFVDSYDISGSAGEIIITNGPSGLTMNIHLKSFDKADFQDDNTIIHEVIHAFHGAAVFETSALEEGMTVSATDAVMQQMIDDGKLPHFASLYLNLDADTYKLWNSQLAVWRDNNAFYTDPNVSKIYQLIGTAWYRLYQADPDVFKKINAAYYPKVQRGMTPDNAMVLDAIRASIAKVGTQSIEEYLTSNAAFNPL